mgnify:CR=1 FL=1
MLTSSDGELSTIVSTGLRYVPAASASSIPLLICFASPLI